MSVNVAKKRRSTPVKVDLPGPSGSANSSFGIITAKPEPESPDANPPTPKRVAFRLDSVRKSAQELSSDVLESVQRRQKRKRSAVTGTEDSLDEESSLVSALEGTPKQKRLKYDLYEQHRKIVSRFNPDECDLWLVHNPSKVPIRVCRDLFDNEFFHESENGASIELALECEEQSYSIRCSRSNHGSGFSSVFLQTSAQEFQQLSARISGAVFVTKELKPAGVHPPKETRIGYPELKAELKQRFIPFGCDYQVNNKQQKKKQHHAKRLVTKKTLA